MSNNVWEDRINDYNASKKGINGQIKSQQNVRFTHPNPLKKRKTDDVNGVITNATSGFSEGMRRQISNNKLPKSQQKIHSVIGKNGEMELGTVLHLDTEQKNPPSVSSVSGITPVTDNTASISIIQCGENWKQIHRNMILEEKQQRKRIDMYVKKYVFSHLKFINSPSMMIYSSERNSLSNMICTGLNITAEEHQSYWSTYSKCVEKSMNGARNDAVSAMKASFLESKSKDIQLLLTQFTNLLSFDV